MAGIESKKVDPVLLTTRGYCYDTGRSDRRVVLEVSVFWGEQMCYLICLSFTDGWFMRNTGAVVQIDLLTYIFLMRFQCDFTLNIV